MTKRKSGWILALAALLPVAACDVDRGVEDDALPEADSRMPDYEVTLPELDVDLDTTTITVPDLDVERPGDIDRTDGADVDVDANEDRDVR